MAYIFKQGSGFSGNAEEIYNELEDIRDQNDGKLTPQQIVKIAKNKKTKLHSQFEWDNGIAGEKWRLWQARALVRAIVYVDEQEKKSSNVFIHIRNNEGQYYQNISVASVDEFEVARDQLLNRAATLSKNAADINQFAKTTKQKKYARVVNRSTERYLQEIRA